MARARNIKPGLFKNEVLGVADPLATLLFEGLWLLADRDGRLEDRPLRIRAEIFPYRDGLDIESLLNWLSDNEFIVRYTCEGKRYIQVNNFEKHQNPHKNEAPSEIPAFSEGCTTSEKIGTRSENIGSAPADSLIPDSLIPDSLQPPCAPPVRDEAPSSDDLFAKFYRLYPNKKGKANAVKAWNKLKLTDDLINQIFDGLARYCVSADWLKDGGQFVPHPATWLNGKRWEDEVKPASNVHAFPHKSRHTGFEERDYTDGLKLKEDGSYGL
ncbi:MAG: phage replication protein [Halopseudomonas sp.]|uniref:phage replication protein n=1 Tax=Halopseudomonas sp. TaxID=2901191 RepID=UPI0030020467